MDTFKELSELAKEGNVDGAVEGLNKLIGTDAKTEEGVKAKENAISLLGSLYVKKGNMEEIKRLLETVRPFFSTVPKAKTAKIVRSLIDTLSAIPGSESFQIALCSDVVEWARSEKRTFLRQRVETKLAALYHLTEEYQESLKILGPLIRDVKKLDDKSLLVEVHLVESRVNYSLKNFAKARAALTASRTAANAIYCPPLLQAEIDLMAGTLNAEDQDFKTAYSYLYEAFENFSSLDENKLALRCLKYMLLCKIMTGNTDEVKTIMNGKAALKYAGDELDAIRAISNAHEEKSLKNFEAAVAKYDTELRKDPFMQAHVDNLYSTLLEQNLLKILRPYSQIEITQVAKIIDLPASQVESKLSQMILDGKCLGTLDQGTGCLILFDDDGNDPTYPTVLETIDVMEKVVDGLYNKARSMS